MITPALMLYLALTLTLAALIVTHAALAVRLIRRRELVGHGGPLALLPPVTPVVAWRAGARVGPVLWGTLLVAYGVLQVMAHA